MKKGSNIQEYLVLRKRAVILTEKGMKQQEIADVLGVGQSTVSHWLIAYKKEGASSLKAKKMGGSKGFLTKEQKGELSELLTVHTAEDYGYEGAFWTRKRVAEVIRQHFGVEYKERSVGDVLKAINFTLQKPKKKVISKTQKK